MTTFKEMMAVREASKERGRPTGFSPKGQLLVRDEYGSFHKSSFEKSEESRNRMKMLGNSEKLADEDVKLVNPVRHSSRIEYRSPTGEQLKYIRWDPRRNVFVDLRRPDPAPAVDAVEIGVPGYTEYFDSLGEKLDDKNVRDLLRMLQGYINDPDVRAALNEQIETAPTEIEDTYEEFPEFEDGNNHDANWEVQDARRAIERVGVKPRGNDIMRGIHGSYASEAARNLEHKGFNTSEAENMSNTFTSAIERPHMKNSRGEKGKTFMGQSIPLDERTEHYGYPYGKPGPATRMGMVRPSKPFAQEHPENEMKIATETAVNDESPFRDPKTGKRSWDFKYDYKTT